MVRSSLSRVAAELLEPRPLSTCSQKIDKNYRLAESRRPDTITIMITDKEIKEMPIDQKLRLMETIWTEISRSADEYTSPDWHKDELQETENRLSSGTETSIDWETAKNKLRNRKDET
jgi:hypothetical protein